MARSRRSFRRGRNKQYGWATSLSDDPLEIPTSGTPVETVIVAGGADLESRAVGGTHANLIRVVGDLAYHPFKFNPTEVIIADPRSAWGDIHWMMTIVDDDDPTITDPLDPTALSDEAVVGHGLIPSQFELWSHPSGGSTSLLSFVGAFSVDVPKMRVDLKSNRRMTSDNDLRMTFAFHGQSPHTGNQNAGFMTWALRALVKFPGG